MKPLLCFAFTLLLLLVACSAPVVKPDAFDANVLARTPLPANLLQQQEGDRLTLEPGPQWLADINPQDQLTFAGYRPSPEELQFCLVVKLDVDKDQIWLLPLEEDETPLTVLSNLQRRSELEAELERVSDTEKDDPKKPPVLKFSISELISQRRLGSPLPVPRHIFAVAANYPSHLEQDLQVQDIQEKRELLSHARARVFLKFPPTRPPGERVLGIDKPLNIILGPYDPILAPRKVVLPSPGEEKPRIVKANIDYEVEIGVVIGKALTWNEVKDASDEDLRKAIAGYVLANDSKLRNPQAMLAIMTYGTLPEDESPYRIGDSTLDARFGIWSERICQWWSYAASWGQYSVLGPFFVAAPRDSSFLDRAMVSARSYAPEETRGVPVPANHSPDTLYLRQCTLTTETDSSSDQMLWSVPQVIRSILAPDSALGFMGQDLRLEPGDVISLGTSGGTVITSKPPAVVKTGRTLLFWFKPIDWHDFFFKRDHALYLRQGDQLFLWAEGLGYQHLSIERADTVDYAAPIGEQE